MTPGSAGAMLAAGALLWRRVDDEVLVLLVERTQHGDISLPKGKLDPGETLPECAQREIEEETGIRVTLGAPLGTSEYRLPDGRDKVVYYWQARATRRAVEASRFRPNDEIRALRWLPLAEAKRACTYEHDVRVIERFEARLEAGHERTIAIVALRHAKAVSGIGWDGDDAARPLAKRGLEQAATVAPAIAAFGVGHASASTALRCRETVAPLAERVGANVRYRDALSQEPTSAPLEARAEIERIVAKAMLRRRGTVLCSHAPVIPEIVTAVVHATDARETQATHRASMLHTAEYTVMHVAPGTPPALVALETHGPAEA